MDFNTQEIHQVEDLLARLTLFAQEHADSELLHYCMQAQQALTDREEGRLWELSSMISKHFRSRHYEQTTLPQDMKQILSAPHWRVLEQDLDLTTKVRIHPTHPMNDCPLCRLGEPGDLLSAANAFRLAFGYWRDTLLASSGEARIRFKKGDHVIVLCSNDATTFIFQPGTVTQVDNRMVDLPQYCEVRLDDAETSWCTADVLCLWQKRNTIKTALDEHHIVLRHPGRVFSDFL